MKITKKCPVCNEQVHIDSRFCVYCGVKLDGSPAPAPAAVVEPAAEDAAPAPAPGTALMAMRCRIPLWDSAWCAAKPWWTSP